jgi:hypothetical protein
MRIHRHAPEGGWIESCNSVAEAVQRAERMMELFHPVDRITLGWSAGLPVRLWAAFGPADKWTVDGEHSELVALAEALLSIAARPPP